MQIYSPVVGIETLPTPHPQASVPPFGSGGRGTLAGEGGGWESHNSDEGTYTVVLFIYICTLWVRGKIEMSKEFQLLSVSRAALQSVGL